MDNSTDNDDQLEQAYDNLCLDLNMDTTAKESAFENFMKIKENYTLEVFKFYVRHFYFDSEQHFKS